MPKLPGRESTKKTIEFERLNEVASFLFAWDKYVQKKTCQVTGCGHPVSGRFENGEWILCGATTGTAVMYDDSPIPPSGRPAKWIVCSCCLARFDQEYEVQLDVPPPG